MAQYKTLGGHGAGIFMTSAHDNQHALRVQRGCIRVQVALQLSNFSLSGNDSSKLSNF
jgi:hypothetical protein